MRKPPKIFIQALCLAVMLTAAGVLSIPRDRAAAPAVRVLFIGNSYTFINNLPEMFSALAASGGYSVKTGMAASGGWTLAAHASSKGTLDALQPSAWDYVVLQEQSEVPSIETSRTASMYPAARSLVRRIREIGAQPLFFVTWAHRNGWSGGNFSTCEEMQTRLDDGYRQIAGELGAAAVPVGDAWMAMKHMYPSAVLWQADASHPDVRGTYLAACTFYAVIFSKSPVGLQFTAGLDDEVVRELQTTAWYVVQRGKNNR